MIRVASFNVMNLNSQKDRDLDGIASLVRKSDIVVMQEVLAENIINTSSNVGSAKSITRKLGMHWDGRWVDSKTNSKLYPYLGNDKRGEGYAFLWNTQRVELLKDDNGKDILPTRYSHYKAGPDKIRLMRDPGYGRFRLRNRPVEIRVITTHIIFGKPKQENINPDLDVDISDIGAITMRRNEFDILAGKIYKNVDEYRKEQNTNAVYTIIIGDYNLNLKGHGVSPATIPEFRCFDSFGNLMKTVQTEPTTINRDCTGTANNYDHCTYNFRCEHVIGDCYRLPVINDRKPEEIKEYRETISDHVPIVVEINC